MPTTSVLLLPFPADTDPADVPTDVAALANGIEAVRNAANGLAGTDAANRVPDAQLPPTKTPIGTSPPGSPQDGQLQVLTDVVANPAYTWAMRYNAAAARWEFVGGTPARAAVATSETTTTIGSYVNLATVGPRFTVPRPGDYLVRFGCTVLDTAADSQILMGVGVGDFAAPALVEARGHISTANYHLSIGGEGVLTGLAGGAEIRAKYLHTIAGTLTVLSRYLDVTPIRVT